MIRALARWLLRSALRQDRVRFYLGRDEWGAHLGVEIDGIYCKRYLQIGDARKWADAMVRCAYDHAEGLPYPVE